MGPKSAVRKSSRSHQRQSRRCRPRIDSLELRRLLSTIYVDAIAPGPTNDGSSWANAYTTLTQALTAATSGTTIEVGQGTYTPTTGTDRTVSFHLINGVEIDGGYAGFGTPNPDSRNTTSYPTILSGAIVTQIFGTTNNTYHVVVGSGTNATAIIDAFTITAGNANGTGATSMGGGIYNSAGSPTIRNCTFFADSATDGAAIADVSSSAPTITGCTFSDNGGRNETGAGVYNSASSPMITNCTFSANNDDAIVNTSSSSAVISNCTISGNTAGGVTNTSSNPTITNCTITQNSAIGINDSSSSPVITDCVISGNHSGGIYNSGGSPKIANCIFVHNTATSGGAIYNSSATSTITNCTFSANTATTDGGAIYNASSGGTIGNSILWGDSAPTNAEIFNTNGSPTVTFTDVEGGGGSKNVDPLFVRTPGPGPDGVWGTSDDDYGNEQIEPWSPVTDAGSNSLIPSGVTTDLAGNPRRADIPTVPDTGSGTTPIVDMGAYEAVPGLLASPGGPYVVLQGQSSVTLNGNGVGTVAGALHYAWDWTGNGLFNSSTLQNPVFSTATLPPGTITISLKVTDAANKSITASTTLTVVPPTIYVDSRAVTGAHTGYDWADALPDLDPALNAAISGQTIDVATGTYYPTSGTDPTLGFDLKNGVTLSGGYAGFGAPNPNLRDFVNDPTILSGDIGTPGVSLDNSYHVVWANNNNSNAVLNGFTITAGNALTPYLDGAGLYLVSGSPTISNCIFTSNSAASGGAIYIGASASLSLTNCSFFSNIAPANGAAIYDDSTAAQQFTNCTFTGNSALSGGGIIDIGQLGQTSSATIVNCNFASNIGGAIVGIIGAITATGTTFTQNAGSSGSSPGAVEIQGGSASTFTNCAFLGNTSTALVDSQAPLSVTDCVFVGNSAVYAGAIDIDRATSNIVNCTFADNTSADAASTQGAVFSVTDSSTVSITNCILWNNSAQSGIQIYQDSSCTLTVNYSEIEEGFAGAGNINTNPLFVSNPSPGPDGKWGTSDDYYGNLSISAASPVVDAGSNAAVPASITTDFAGNPRFQDIPTTPDTGRGTAPIVDMGAYEAVPGQAANTGGPYVVLQAQSLILTGHGASTISGTLQYAWDWTGNGLFTDATGPDPTFPVSSFSPGTTINISLRVTDSAGNSIVGTSSIYIAPLVVYVDAGVVGGANDGVDWSDAFTSLASALNIAIAGQTLDIAGGTYEPTTNSDRTISFTLVSGVSVEGGYAGSADPSDPNIRNPALYPTILSGDIGTAGNNSGNSYHVLVGSNLNSSTLLNGVTITDGNADGTGYNGYNDASGGGMFIYASTLTISDCIFNANYATTYGGAISISSASPTISNCTFTANYCYRGGAVYDTGSSPAFMNCIFTANSAGLGGAIVNEYSSSASITNCFFNANTAKYDGGAILEDQSSSLNITRCTFLVNSTTVEDSSEGGGAIDDENCPMTIVGCMFNANNSASFGGAVCSDGGNPQITNCTFVANASTNGGGAIANNLYSAITLINCDLTANSTPSNGGAIYNYYSSTAILTNCILWANTSTGSEIYNSTSSATVTYSDIQGGYAGVGNLNSYPLFVRDPSPGPDGVWGTADDDYGDLHLQSTSPCIDAGSNAAIPTGITTDFDGDPRIFNSIVDMGAYEVHATNVTWTGAADGINWTNPGNWSTDLVPVGDTDATIGAGFSVQIGSGSYGVHSLIASSPIEIADGATLVLNGVTTFGGGLNIDDGGKLQNYADSILLVINGLNISTGGTIDLRINDLIIHNGNISQVTSQIGTGIISSATTSNTTLGVELNDDGTPSHNPLMTTFDNQTVTNTDVLVKYTYFGDANLDGSVTAADYIAIDNGFNNKLTGWNNGDFNYDGVINGDDYTLIDNAFNTQGAVPLAAVPIKPLATVAAPMALAPNTLPATTWTTNPDDSSPLVRRKVHSIWSDLDL